MATAQVLGGSGAVQVGPTSFIVQELSVQAEMGLLQRFRKLAKEAMGPGSYYAQSLPTLNWLAEQGKHADRAALMEIIGRLIAHGSPVSDEAAYEFRQTPDGVAEELFWRTRKTTPDATRDEFRAIINDVNALEVHLGILDAVAPKKA